MSTEAGPVTRAEQAEARVRELEAETRECFGDGRTCSRNRCGRSCHDGERSLEQELRATSYMLDECRRIARRVIEENARLAKEIAEMHRELSALETTNGELLDDLERLARAEKERDSK